MTRRTRARGMGHAPALSAAWADTPGAPSLTPFGRLAGLAKRDGAPALAEVGVVTVVSDHGLAKPDPAPGWLKDGASAPRYSGVDSAGHFV